MIKDESDWIVYVAWKTIVKWKKKARDSAAKWGSKKVKSNRKLRERNEYPFQYASKQKRFMKMNKGSNLWLVSLPQFKGYCQAPAIMARLNLRGVYDTMEGSPVEISEHSDHFGRYLAVGNPSRIIDSYPPLYNVFDVLVNSEFEGSVKNLNKFIEWLNEGNFGDIGPYYRLAQHFRTIRHLTADSSRKLRRRHQLAVKGRRIFLSYKTTDMYNLSVNINDKYGNWLKLLVNSLEKFGIISWWDEQQMLGKTGAWNKQTNLIKTTLDDGVKQALWFVALGTDGYGSTGNSEKNWTLDEWETAGIETKNKRRRGKLRRLLIEFGGNDLSSLLPGKADVSQPVAKDVSPDHVAKIIARVVKSYRK